MTTGGDYEDDSHTPTPVEILATALSIAVRVEPQLIRAVRLEVFPNYNVGTEADLWFSDLVRSRGAQGIVVEPEERNRLRANLTALLTRTPRTDSIHRIGDIVARIHWNLSPALRLEERINWLAVTGRVDEIDDALRPALKAVAVQNRQGVARWFEAAWNRLPESARQSLTAWKLAQFTTMSKEISQRSLSTRSGVVTSDIADIVDALGDVRLFLRRTARELHISDPTNGELNRAALSIDQKS